MQNNNLTSSRDIYAACVNPGSEGFDPGGTTSRTSYRVHTPFFEIIFQDFTRTFPGELEHPLTALEMGLLPQFLAVCVFTGLIYDIYMCSLLVNRTNLRSMHVTL